MHICMLLACSWIHGIQQMTPLDKPHVSAVCSALSINTGTTLLDRLTLDRFKSVERDDTSEIFQIDRMSPSECGYYLMYQLFALHWASTLI